jgi:Sec7-like guanine-nucleotide exchange factor
MFKEGKTDKPYDQMYQPIKWQITKQKENQTMSDWLISLRKRADIKILGDLVPQDRGGK